MNNLTSDQEFQVVSNAIALFNHAYGTNLKLTGSSLYMKLFNSEDRMITGFYHARDALHFIDGMKAHKEGKL